MIFAWHLPWIAACLIAVSAVPVLAARAPHWGLVDRANERSLHSGSKPRSGGLGILLAIACGWLFAALMGYPPDHWLALSLAGLAVAGISLLDDLGDVPPLPRFTIHLLAGATPLLAGFGLGTLAVPGFSVALGIVASTIMTVLFVVGFINLYNFMDGMDGFAGGMTLFGFGFFAALGVTRGDMGFALACAVIAAAAGGFLLFNFPPARVFMGDAGAATLGFLTAAIVLWADAAGIAPLWIGVMIFSPFFLDATVTVSRRACRGERIWEAHKSHYYQRLVESGWSHRRTVLAEYALMLGCGLTAVAVVDAVVGVQWAAIIIWLGLYCLCAIGVRRRESTVHV